MRSVDGNPTKILGIAYSRGGGVVRVPENWDVGSGNTEHEVALKHPCIDNLG